MMPLGIYYQNVFRILQISYNSLLSIFFLLFSLRFTRPSFSILQRILSVFFFCKFLIKRRPRDELPHRAGRTDTEHVYEDNINIFVFIGGTSTSERASENALTALDVHGTVSRDKQ